MTAVVGANGSGKSTLIKEIAGVIKPISGRCESRCQRLAYLPQQSEIDRSFPAHVIDLISLGFWQRRGLLGRITAEDKADLERCLDAVGHRLHTWPDDDRSTRVVLIGQDMPQNRSATYSMCLRHVLPAGGVLQHEPYLRQSAVTKRSWRRRKCPSHKAMGARCTHAW